MRHFFGVRTASSSSVTSALGQVLTITKVTGFASPAALGLVQNEPLCWLVEGANGDWEIGVFEWTSSGPTQFLTRIMPLATYVDATDTHVQLPSVGLAFSSGPKRLTHVPVPSAPAVLSYRDTAAGKFIMPSGTRPTGTSNTINDWIYAMPIWVEAYCKVDAILFDVTTGQTGTFTAALYLARPGGGPGGKLSDVTAAVSIATSGLKAALLTSVVTLSPGLYYALFKIDGFTVAPTFRAHSNGSANTSILGANSAVVLNLSGDMLYLNPHSDVFEPSYTATGWNPLSSGAYPFVALRYL